MRNWVQSFVRIALISGVMGLIGCAGTVQRQTADGASKISGTKYQSVSVVLSDAARKLQADNAQFNQNELTDYIRRRLEGNALLQADSPNRVEVVIDSFRVRSTAAAVVFGVMAGVDSIHGRIRVLGPKNVLIHSYVVDTQYGFGGWAGGDGMRMGWLYEKFSELAVAELGGSTDKTYLVGRYRDNPAPTKDEATLITAAPVETTPQPIVIKAVSPASASAATASTQLVAKAPVVKQVSLESPSPSNFAPLEAVDRLPDQSPQAVKGYQFFLSRPSPRAFAVDEKGGWGSAWNGKDAMTRALNSCLKKSAAGECRLYAVDDKVVWASKP